MPNSGVLVLFDPVRSADPPSVSGMTLLITSSAISEDFRVATFGMSAETCFFKARMAPASFFGGVPVITRSNSF